MTIGDSDYFSNLPGDCIITVFSFLNQLELDIVAPVCQTINTFVNYSRSKAARSQRFLELRLVQIPFNQFALFVDDKRTKGSIIRIKMDENGHAIDNRRGSLQMDNQLSSPAKKLGENEPNADTCERCEQPEHREFTNEMTIGNKDNFSSMPADCLIAVFALLNQLELDVLAPVSQKVNDFVEHARAKAAKSSRFSKIRLQHKESPFNQFELVVKGEGTDIRATIMRDNGKIINDNECDVEEVPVGAIKPTPHEMYQLMHWTIQRFGIEELRFRHVLIDDSFILHFKRWCKVGKPQILDLSKNNFGDSFDKKKLFDRLLSSGINDLTLDGPIDEEFIIKYSQNVLNPNLQFTFGGLATGGRQKLSKEATDVLHLYQGIWLTPHMVVDIDRIIEAIIKRLRSAVKGIWELTIPRTITNYDIINCLEPDLEWQTRPIDEFIINVKGSVEQMASVYCISTVSCATREYSTTLRVAFEEST